MENSEYAKDIRLTIRHENELINHRISWMATCNGLLFTALGFVWGKPGVWDKPSGKALVLVLAFVGITTSASAYYSLYLTRKALGRLHGLWAKKEISGESVPPVSSWDEKVRPEWLLPWKFLPLVFAAAWIFIIIIVITFGA